jgi:hypothetical protein
MARPRCLKWSATPETIAAFAGAFGNLADVYEHKHMYAQATNGLRQTAILIGDPESGRAIQRVYGCSGCPAAIHEELNRELQRVSAGHYVSPTGIAGLYAAQGDAARAFESLENGYEEHSSGMQFLGVSSDFDLIRSNPQYQYWLGVLALPAAIARRAKSASS